jgi:hypothetical protein
MAAAKKKHRGQWMEDIWLAAEAKKNVRMETSEGVVRSGRLTGIRTRVMEFNKSYEDFPVELELNGDPTDTVPIYRLKKLSIDD